MLLKSIDEAASSYDAVVIGGGLGGMTAAKRLVDAGRPVLLVEAYKMLGGYATYFKRKKHIFDVALHAFPYGVQKTFRKYWSKELAARVVPLPRIRYENPEFSFTTTFETEDFKRILQEEFSIPREQSENFFAACRERDFFPPSDETTREFVEKYFPGRSDLARFILETVTYATGTNLDDPATVYAIIFSNFALKGTCTFRGGTDYLLAEMQRLLLAGGADILLNTKVEKILVEDGVTKGVIAGGREIGADCVVSNANLKETALKLVNMQAISPWFAEKVAEVPLSVSVAQVYLGIKAGETIPEIADILFASEEAHYDAAAFRHFPPRSASFSFYFPHGIRPDYDGTEIVATVCAEYADWDGLSKSDYEDKKRQLADTIIAMLEKFIPDIREKLDHIETATPKTLERYTGHWQGASFGTKFPGFAAANELPKRVKGLFHCGAEGIIMSGWLGTANSGALAASNADSYLESLSKP